MAIRNKNPLRDQLGRLTDDLDFYNYYSTTKHSQEEAQITQMVPAGTLVISEVIPELTYGGSRHDTIVVEGPFKGYIRFAYDGEINPLSALELLAMEAHL